LHFATAANSIKTLINQKYSSTPLQARTTGYISQHDPASSIFLNSFKNHHLNNKLQNAEIIGTQYALPNVSLNLKRTGDKYEKTDSQTGKILAFPDRNR
jgi:hypothetical protein